MSWLRLDDKFAEHGKLMSLPRADRWAWLELLCYCARQQNDGHIPDRIGEVLRYATPALLAKCERAGLIDKAPDGSLSVHDWRVYNGQTLAEKIVAYLEDHPDASANEVQKAVGGKRQLVLKLVPALRETGSGGGSSVGTDGNQLGGSPSGFARANPSPNNPTPSEVLLGDGRSEETEAAAPATPNGAAPLNEGKLAALAGFTHREWHHYPNLDVLRDELTDRGATPDQADQIIEAEKAARMTTSA